MTASQVDNLIVGANAAAKRAALAERLRALEDQIARQIAFNSLGPCLSRSHEVWRALTDARSLVHQALATVAQER